MKKTEELSNRFTEVTLNGRWIANTNFKEALQSVDWHQADSFFRKKIYKRSNSFI